MNRGERLAVPDNAYGIAVGVWVSGRLDPVARAEAPFPQSCIRQLDGFSPPPGRSLPVVGDRARDFFAGEFKGNPHPLLVDDRDPGEIHELAGVLRWSVAADLELSRGELEDVFGVARRRVTPASSSARAAQTTDSRTSVSCVTAM